jgi:hypothetical protein
MPGECPIPDVRPIQDPGGLEVFTARRGRILETCSAPQASMNAGRGQVGAPVPVSLIDAVSDVLLEQRAQHPDLDGPEARTAREHEGDAVAG